MNSIGNQQSLRILAVGALLGILLGALNISGWITPTQPLSETSIASVNSTQIRLLEYQRAINMLASDKRSAITEQDRDLVLQRLIDEELLVQHGIDSGLIRSDLTVRGMALQSVLAGIMVEIKAGNNQQGTLEDYVNSLKRSADIEWSASWEQP